MSNILFIVCPFSCVENKLKQKYGSNAFFISSPGAIIPYNDHLFIEVLMGEIVRNNINAIYFVNDASSRIINSVILNKDLFGLDAEHWVESIYKQAFATSLKGRSNQYQLFRLAELIAHNQKNEFLTNGVFTDLIIEEKIVVKTLVISSSMQFVKESRIAAPIKATYEL
ncbi:hypothetical protein [Sediminibacterium sp.]|uniref:hypothetical protein n=1 Tax=Sediminibacterium sp. TaxID=1917865 RepID=UPI002735CC53|nr:hypothetical protein [Sediminibacterium sp.]MDP3392649.1 hypothetical protein [Sediminibacterium sp.]MDP3566108.1 hypothetical protein [Sediminibacterium sp.]